MRSAFWQQEPPMEINLLKLPIIMAPAMVRKQTNNDILKDSLLDKSITHSQETYRAVIQLIDYQGNAFLKMEILKTTYQTRSLCLRA